MKRTLISLILISAFTGTAHAATKEDFCLVLGQYASKAAELRDKNIPEEHLYKSVTKRMYRSIISYVYTMGNSPADSRRMVYLKCLADEFQPDED